MVKENYFKPNPQILRECWSNVIISLLYGWNIVQHDSKQHSINQSTNKFELNAEFKIVVP